MSNHRKAFTFKDTFWSKLRIEKDLSLQDIADIVGLSDASIGQYFSGATIPPDRTLMDICDLFDVDYETGRLEFERANRAWKAEHDKTLKYSARVPYQKKRKAPEHKDISNAEDVLNAIYSKVSCSDFVAIYNLIMGNTTDVDPLEILYGKVDYDTYYKIIKII